MSRFSLIIAVLMANVASAEPTRHLLPEGLAEAECVVLAPKTKRATILLPTAMVEGDVSVVLVDGRIAAVGSNTGAVLTSGGATYEGRSCAHVDTSDHTVTPGFIETSTQLGLVEVSLEAATRNANDEGETLGAALRVSDAYDPSSTLIPIARMEGVTSAITYPSGGRIAGLAAFVDLAGSTQAQAIVDETVAVAASLGGPSRAAAISELRSTLEDARLFARNRAAYERGATRDYVADHRDLQALQPVLRREVPLVVQADRAADIEGLIRLATEQRVQLVIRGGAEAHLHAAALAAAKIGVIVDPMVYGPGGFDQRFARPDNAALLQKAGVPVMLSTFSSHNARLLRQQAGNAVRGGLDPVAALQAITQTPAEVFNRKDRGTLAVGKVGNLVVWAGDPLELRTSVAQVFIGGRAIPLDSRQWRLFMRYEELSGKPVSVLPLPEN